MKTSLFLFIMCFCASLIAQSNQNGQVIYEKIFDYDFGDYKGNPAWEAYLADLPKQGRSKFVLSFNENHAFYEKDIANETAVPEKLQNALGKASYGKAPKPETHQVFYDFENGKQIEQVEFMTRSFQVNSELPTQAWKLTNKRKKVLDYVCIGAELTLGEEVYTAWFSSEIPISAGPSIYYGLPGLVLAVEKNEAVFILATKIDLSVLPINLESKLKDGKQMSRKNFDETVAEKTEEYNAAAKNKARGLIKKGE
ncbi:GLPGLI family protein [uncultured Roseivirga sp.]|uniref:GLPGLI family protein n=1 Tax=uncultured Roseivirga sp. TaxID=543088 RepID=UPI0030D9163E